LRPSPVKISIVSYTNTLPFKWALKRSSLLERIDLQEDIPSICAQKLKYKQVDLALVPVALIPELDSYFIETDYCIGANGKVDSVKLYSQVPLNDIKTITLDYQSKSSITLTKVLVKFFWKLRVNYVDAKPGFEEQIRESDAAVVIGDRTFSLNGKYAYEFDLAAEWKKFTGLPFVFAAWLSTSKLAPDFIQEFNAVLKEGITHIDQAVNDDHDPIKLSKSLTREYLTERISYSLDADKLKALDLFLSYIQQL
jgi:chorismate dehydratase